MFIKLYSFFYNLKEYSLCDVKSIYVALKAK